MSKRKEPMRAQGTLRTSILYYSGVKKKWGGKKKKKKEKEKKKKSKTKRDLVSHHEL